MSSSVVNDLEDLKRSLDKWIADHQRCMTRRLARGQARASAAPLQLPAHARDLTIGHIQRATKERRTAEVVDLIAREDDVVLRRQLSLAATQVASPFTGLTVPFPASAKILDLTDLMTEAEAQQRSSSSNYGPEESSALNHAPTHEGRPNAPQNEGGRAPERTYQPTDAIDVMPSEVAAKQRASGIGHNSREESSALNRDPQHLGAANRPRMGGSGSGAGSSTYTPTPPIHDDVSGAAEAVVERVIREKGLDVQTAQALRTRVASEVQAAKLKRQRGGKKMTTEVVAEVIAGVPGDWLPDELIKAIETRRAQQSVRVHLEQRRDELKRGLAETTGDAEALLTRTRAIRELDDGLAAIPVDAMGRLPGQALAVERASSALLSLGTKRFLIDPPIVIRRHEFRVALEAWKRRQQGDPPTTTSETTEDQETIRIHEQLTRRADGWAAQVRAWQESASRSEVISTLTQAGVLVHLGEALVVEGEAFSAPFDQPGRPARDLVGRIR